MAISDYYENYTGYLPPEDPNGLWQSYDGGFIDSYGNPVTPRSTVSPYSQQAVLENGKVNFDKRAPIIEDQIIRLLTEQGVNYNPTINAFDFSNADKSALRTKLGEIDPYQLNTGSLQEQDLNNYGFDYFANNKNNAAKYYGDIFGSGKVNELTNKQLYDSIVNQQLAQAEKSFGLTGKNKALFSKALSQYSPYDPYTDYRGQGNNDPFYSDSLSFNVPGFQSLVDERKKGRDKAFNKQVLSSVITFLTAGAGAALGGASAASGAAGSAAGGAGGAAGGLGGAAGGGLGGAAGGGGLFAGSGGLFGSFGSSLADAAINSAIQGAISSGVSGGDPFKGALTGGITGGLGSALGGIDFGLGAEGNAALSAALKGGVSSGLSGGNPLIGAATAGAGSGLNSLFKGNFGFGGADTPTSPVGGVYQGGGYQLPGGFLGQNNSQDFGINSPFNLTGQGGNVGLFDDFDFGSDAGQAFQDSIGQNLFDFSGQLSNDDFINQLFGYGSGTGVDNLDVFSGLDPINLTNTSFLPGFQDEFGGLLEGLNSLGIPDAGQYIDLSNSGGGFVNEEAISALPSGSQSLLKQAIGKLFGGAAGAGGSGGGLSQLLSTALGLGGSYLNQSAAERAAGRQADATIEAAKIAADAAKFRPVGVTTRFGQSQFGYDDKGNLSTAGYNLSPDIKAQQDALLANSGGLLQQYLGAQQATQGIGEAGQSAINLGKGYLATTPQEQAAKYYAEQQALIQPTRERQFADLQNLLQNQGRGGLAVGGTSTLGAANPQLEAYYNALKQQDLQLAANATRGGQDYATFGAGLAGTGADLLKAQYGTQSAAFQPYNTSLGGATYLEGLGQNALDQGARLGSTASSANAQSGQLLASGLTNAAAIKAPTDAISGFGGLLTGAGNQLQNYQQQQQQQALNQSFFDALSRGAL